MCGIAGLVVLDPTRAPPVDTRVLDDMTDALVHRGPDGRGTWVSADGRVGLGHRRLSIIDLSAAGRQPMANEDRTIWVTFNGEIYNHQELRRRLEAQGHRFRSRTDTEVLVHLYEEVGADLVHHLDGDFAFGLWDDRAKVLLLARDPAGVKPLYFTKVDGCVLFASEIKALLRHPGVTREMDEEALYHYLTYLVTPAPFTLFQGIFKLPPASVMTYSFAHADRTAVPRRYWLPEPGQVAASGNLDGEVERLFARSVQKRLMSDVPVGVLYSGGTDSTLNAVFFAAAAAPEPVHTFTVGMEGTTLYQDERAIARRRSTTLGSVHHEVVIGVDDLLETAETLVQYQDEPISDPVCVPLFFVTKLAKEAGTTVLHAGEGADELFCGYDNYRRFLRHDRWLWRPMRRLPGSIAGLGARVLQRSDQPRRRKIADVLRRLARGQELFMSSAVAYYEQEKQPVLAEEFRRRHAGLDSFEVVEPFYRHMRERFPDASFLQTLTFIELQLRLPELLLMRVDKMSMANAVEVRVPFLDHDLVRFALSAPETFKLRDGVSKEPLKRLAARYVDRASVYEPKRGFGAPIQEWFGGPLGHHMRDLLVSDRAAIGQYFDVAEIGRRLDRGPRTVNEAFQLWIVYNLLQWRRSFLGSGSAISA